MGTFQHTVSVDMHIQVRGERLHDDGIDVFIFVTDPEHDMLCSMFVRDDMSVDVQRDMWVDMIADNIPLVSIVAGGRDSSSALVVAIDNAVRALRAVTT